MHLSLCDDSSDQGAKAADDSTYLETSRRLRGEREGAPGAQLDDVMSEVGVLVRRARCAETKAEIATRRLDRVEREQYEADDAEHEAILQKALAHQSKAVKVLVDKWLGQSARGVWRRLCRTSPKVVEVIIDK